MARRIMLVIGHSWEDEGAVSQGGTSEYDFNKRVAMKVFERDEFKGVDIILKKRCTAYKSLPSQINEMRPNIVISLHCNAYEEPNEDDEEVNGTEVLYWGGSTNGKKYAEIFQKNLVDKLGYKDRGIKGIDEDDRGGFLLQKTEAPTILLEPFFIDALSEDEIEDNVDKVVEAILDSIWEVI